MKRFGEDGFGKEMSVMEELREEKGGKPGYLRFDVSSCTSIRDMLVGHALRYL